MYVLWIDDNGIRHGSRNGLCGLLDLHAAPEFLGQEISRLCNPDAQAFPGNGVGLAPNEVGTREDGDMRTKHAFRTTRHHERDPLLHAVRRQIDVRREDSA
jgi:hypothetical protein